MCKALMGVSTDSRKGADQNLQTFWTRVKKKFDESFTQIQNLFLVPFG